VISLSGLRLNLIKNINIKTEIMANLNQVATLLIDDNGDDIGFVTNFDISFNQAANSIVAHITCGVNYTDKSPVFAFFMERQPKKLKLLVENLIDSSGPTTRTIELEKAICTEYIEKYDMQHQSFDNINDLMAVFTVKADGANLGSVNIETK
jgi:hypothetical protein